MQTCKHCDGLIGGPAVDYPCQCGFTEPCENYDSDCRCEVCVGFEKHYEDNE